jgi:Core-2/I-Branching enzyme
MKIAYLVLAHNNPQVLERAIAALRSENCDFFIHIDRKCDIQRFSSLKGTSIFFAEQRIPVYWGQFSVVQAIMLLLQQALLTREYDYLVLLSGSDYPLRSADYIQEFLKHNGGFEFISLAKMPAPGKPLARINTIRFPSNQPVRRLIFRILAKFGLARRDYRKHLGLEPYSGEAWWALTRSACGFILDFIRHNQYVERYFQNSAVPDESFFHTILGNSEFKSKIRRNLHYTDWRAQAAHPALIDDRHLEFFEIHDKICVSDIYGSGEVLFARKFCDQNLTLLDRIDRMIARKDEERPVPSTNAFSNVPATAQHS